MAGRPNYERRWFGIGMNIVLGIVGGIVGGWLFDYLGVSIASGIVGYIITAAVGAIVILFVANLFKK